jgi:ArsR family transcriptional regulator
MQADVLKALAHPLRLAIADYLRDGEQCVCDIAEHVDAERSNVSRHLSVMLNAGVLDRRKDGLRAMYRLQTPCVLNLFSCVTRVLEERLEVEQGALESR